MSNRTFLPGRTSIRTASERQLQFLVSLREEIARLKNAEGDVQLKGQALIDWVAPTDVAHDAYKCSEEIDKAIQWRDRLRAESKERMAQAPRTADEAAVGGRREVTEGMWIIGAIETGQVFKVQVAVHGSGNLYAKKFIPGEIVDGEREKGTFEYVPGAMKLLAAEGRKMTMAEAKEYGALYGTCCRCGRTLTKEKSIERGIGPVCGKYFD